jgi:hypothetical protein
MLKEIFDVYSVVTLDVLHIQVFVTLEILKQLLELGECLIIKLLNARQH